MPEHSIKQQLRRNAVALISLTVALTSLGYNTWRNELSESNRNTRVAAFEMLSHLGQLQEVVFYRHYDQDQQRGNPRAGWARVLTIRDLSLLVSPPVRTASDELYKTWDQHWANLGSEEKSAEAVLDALDSARKATSDLLRSLD